MDLNRCGEIIIGTKEIRVFFVGTSITFYGRKNSIVKSDGSFKGKTDFEEVLGSSRHMLF